jgi:hypothetical protein
MKHYLFKSLLFSILIFSCQVSQQKIEPKIARVERAKVSSLQNEEYLLPILDDAGFNIKSSKSGRVDKLSNVDGVFLNTDSILMVLQPDSVSYAYTFLAEKSAKQGSFKNLVLHKVKNGYWAYFQEFTPKETIKSKSDFSFFTGTINRYDLSNKLLSTWNYERGAPATLSGGRTQSCVNFNLVCTQWTKKFDDQALTFTVGPPCIGEVYIEISSNSACFITDTVVPGGGAINRQFSMGTFLEYYKDGGPGGGNIGGPYGSSPCNSTDGGSSISNGSSSGSCDFSIGVFPPSAEELKRLLEEYIDLIADPETALADEPKIFTATEVEGAGGKTWLRTTDSEYKMLNKLASDLGGTPGVVKSNIYGEIKIISENPYCASCQGIIQQFNQMFPNIKLILVDGAK